MLCSGALALAGALAPIAADAAPAGPPPKLPDIGPPPMLPDTGPPSLPPTDAPPSPTTPPTAAPTRPANPSGPPVMRPSARPQAPQPSAPPVVAPPPATDPSIPAAPPPTSTPPSPDPAIPTPPAPTEPVLSDSLPPPAGAPAAPAGPSSLEAPLIAGADPVAPEQAAKPEPEPKSLEELEEEAARARRKQPKKWRHAGMIVEPRLGVLGCTRQFCAGTGGHHERPGVLLGGFIGGNLLGLLDVGVEAEWGTLRAGDLDGKNAIMLYGLDPARVEQALSRRLGTKVDVDDKQLIVHSAKGRSVSAGPALRVHFIRKGRGVAYAGLGIHYRLWRNYYETTGGPTRMDFHGFSMPFRVGGGAFVHPNIAVLGEFAYHHSFYAVTGISHPELSGVAPLTLIEGAVLDAGANLRKGLPHFWSFSVSVRFRLGL